MYSGKVCPKCGKGCVGEYPISGLEKEKNRIKKRFGSIPCNNCFIEHLGGQEELDKIKKETILKEMGL